MTLQDLLIEELQDLYDAEQQLVKALEMMTTAAGGDALRAALGSHRQETMTHVTRLEEVFALVGVKAKGHHCEGIAGIIKEGSKLLHKTDVDSAVRDASI